MSGVRFSERNQEIAPVHMAPGRYERDDLSPEAQAELRNLSMTLQNSRIQASRMGDFTYEPVSLPASRVSAHYIPGKTRQEETSLTSVGSITGQLKTAFRSCVASCLFSTRTIATLDTCRHRVRRSENTTASGRNPTAGRCRHLIIDAPNLSSLQISPRLSQ